MLILAFLLSFSLGGATTRSFAPPAQHPIADAASPVLRLKELHKFSARTGKFSGDGSKMLLAEGNCQEVVSVPSAKRVCQIKLSPNYRIWPDAFSPDGRLAAAVVSDHENVYAYLQVLVWDAQTGKQLGAPFVKGPWDGTIDQRNLSFSQDSRWLLSSLDHDPLLMDVLTGHQIKMPGLSPVSPGMVLLGSYFSDDGRFLIRELADSLDKRTRHRFELSVWEIATGKEYRLKVPPPEGNCRFSPNVKFAAISGRFGRVFSLQVVEVETGKILHSFSRQELGWFSRAPTVSPDGKLLAVGGMRFFRVLSVSTGRILFEGEVVRSHFSLFWERSEIYDWVDDLNFSPDGRYLETAAGAGPVKLWEIVQNSN